MITDICLNKGVDKETSVISLNANNLTNLSMSGEITDKIYHSDGRIEVIKGHNLVVSSFLNLVMCLLKQEAGYKGIQYWAVGSGDASWDTSLPSPEKSATKLTSELGRVQILPEEIKFLTPEFEESPTPTYILQISHTFGTQDCNGVWREFGIFGGNATELADSGILINKRHHKVLTKTEEMTVERTMRFTLNLV